MNRVVWILLFVLIVCLDTFGVWFPDWIDRKITTYFPVPFLIVWYVFSQRKWNLIYLISSVLTFMGVCLFNMHYVEEQNLGMVCYSGGVLLYIVLLWPLVTKLRLQYYLILLIVTTLLFWLSVTGLFRLTPDLFYVFVYGWLVVLFFVSTLIVYFHQRNKISASALLAGTLLLGGTINTALSMFFGVSLLLQIITVFSFSCMHYAVQHYVILLRIEKKDSFVEL